MSIRRVASEACLFFAGVCVGVLLITSLVARKIGF